MYCKASPSYDSEDNKKLDANDPETFKNQPDEIVF